MNTLPHDPAQGVQARNPRSFILLFVGILLLVALAIWVWQAYLSPEARSAQQMQKNYESYQQWEQSYKDALRNDTYGGKTPEETLALFIDALEKEDVDLASKYFLIDEKLSREKWIAFLSKIKENGNLIKFADDLKKYDEKSKSFDPYYLFIYKNEDGSIALQITLQLNKESNVWKIESL